jgi:sugar phosphate isomerase/epimerase
MQLVMFSKMLQEFDIDPMGDIVKGLGLDGVDLTVRPGGHVEPAAVETDLEPAVELLRDKGLAVPMLTTALESADDPAAEPIFEVAAACGVTKLKLGYWQVREFGAMRDKVAEAKQALVGINALAEKYGVSANIHVHSGDFLSAEAAVVWMLIERYDPACIGAYPDLCHMGLEGSRSGWKQGLDLLGDRINMVGVKNAGLFQETDADGNVRWVGKLLPVWEGLTPFPEAFGFLRQLRFEGPCSFHSEYKGGFSFKDLTTEELIAQTGEDVAYVRRLLAES